MAINKVHLLTCLLYWLSLGIRCTGQTIDPRGVVNETVFEGLASHDTINGVPSRWKLAECNRKEGLRLEQYKAMRLGENTVLSIEGGEHPFIQPTQNLSNILSDSFTISYDFLLVDYFATQCLHFSLANRTSTCDDIRFCITRNDSLGFVLECDRSYPATSTILTRLPEFQYNAWHNFVVSYRSRTFKCYLDNKLIYTTPQDTPPVLFTLHGWKSVMRKNIKLSTGKIGNLFSNLETQTVTTHLINFETGSAKLIPACLPIINALAEQLRTNVRLKIQICGHTDSDGNRESNLKLSEDRAAEIKKQLVQRGIAAERLSTIGYGDTRPIETNATEAGKAANRRVAFRKQ